MDNLNDINTVITKPKRGRKSKKELLASLNIETFIQPTTLSQSNTSTPNIVSLNVKELENNLEVEQDQELKLENNIVIIPNPQDQMNFCHLSTPEQKPSIKKRGRKPKGGKIIQQVITLDNQKDDKPNVILHLKCSMKDLQISKDNNNLDSYNFIGKNELNYDIIGSENITNISSLYNEKQISNDYLDDEEDEPTGKDTYKEVWKKLKQLEHNLHINNINKKSACFWDTCEFDNPPIYIPKHFINGTYNVYGCFCSPECGVAYLMNENIDSSTKFERYHLFNHIYSKIYDYKKNIKPSPNPYYMLEKYYGNLSIQEYRSLLRNERLFLIVDKPLTRILPELHEDNDEFILNNKIIPSNNYQLKTRLQRKKQNKTSIINEKFGVANQSILE